MAKTDTPIVLEVEWNPGLRVFDVTITSDGTEHTKEMREPEYRNFCRQSETIIQFGGKAFFFRGRSGTVTIRTKRGMVDYFKGVLRNFDTQPR